MNNLTIKTYRPDLNIQNPYFYVLSKGLNIGKPLEKPCPNCFVFTLQSDSQKDFYYWLIFGLWRTKAFHPFLRGSVIPFITLTDLKKCIQSGIEQANRDLDTFHKNVDALKFLDLKEKQFHQNLQLIDEARKMIFYKYRRRQF